MYSVMGMSRAIPRAAQVRRSVIEGDFIAAANSGRDVPRDQEQPGGGGQGLDHHRGRDPVIDIGGLGDGIGRIDLYLKAHVFDGFVSPGWRDRQREFDRHFLRAPRRQFRDHHVGLKRRGQSRIIGKRDLEVGGRFRRSGPSGVEDRRVDRQRLAPACQCGRPVQMGHVHSQVRSGAVIRYRIEDRALVAHPVCRAGRVGGSQVRQLVEQMRIPVGIGE